ncbi:filamentous hemagglutinin, partial [Fusarium pseudocircinatum]
EPPLPEGPICECGYTYCSSVLKDMDNPWNEDQLSQAYCSTPNVKCDGESPASSIDNALFICLCDKPSQTVGNHLEFLCGCDKCLVVKPDYRGRCKTPPLAGSKGGKGDGKGNKVRGTNPLGFWM